MIGFAAIAGGAPSSVGAMTDHLLNQTLAQDQARLAAYYSRGMVPDRAMEALARQVADGRATYSEGLDALVQTYIRDGGDLGLLEAAEARLGKRLGDLVFRIQEGLEEAPLAVVRPDMDLAAAMGLGIDPGGLLSRDEINALLAGRRTDGERVEGKHYAKERRLPVDPKTGEERYSGPIGSYDFCPTPDKSVSVAWAFASPVEQARIYNAHLEAAREAVGYIAGEVGRARLGKGGQDGAEPGHVAWLEFTHHTSRRTQFSVENDTVKVTQDVGSPGDPNLHTHFLIPNAVFCDSGRVGSLDTAAIGGFIFEADAVYQASLAQKLREAGFDIALDQRTGAARMTIIPDDIRTLFSKRTVAGEALAKIETLKRGEAWDRLTPSQQEARTKAATQSLDQKVKGGKDDVANVGDWKRQALAFGWEAPPSLELYGPPPPEPEREQRIRLAYEVALPFLAERLEHKAVLTHWDVRVAATRGLVHAGFTDLSDISAVTQIMRSDGVEQYGERTALVWGLEEGKRYTSITTALHESQEREFIQLARTASDDRSTALPAALLHEKIATSGLDFTGEHGAAQRAVIERLGRGGRFGLAVAAAGAGKTTALKPLVAAWRDDGRDVYGASLGWRQADDLTQAGIDQRNVKAFSVLIDAVHDGSIKLGPRSVVAVDEWGLLGTRQALELLRLQAKHGFQVVALGDDKQCAAIQAGAIIDLSRRALGAEQVPEILTTLRQQTEREREIVGLFREGRAAEALDMKRADRTAEMVPGGYSATVERVATLYAERLRETGHAPTISAPTNTDAHRISEAVREQRRKMGLLGPDIRAVRATDGERDYTLRLAVGDRVRLFRSTGAKYDNGRGGPIGRNGSVLEVVAATERAITLRTKAGRVGTVPWDDLASRAGRVRLAYGDATTIHTAQGSTSREHIAAFPAGSQVVDGLQGYSANTRYQQRGWILTNEAAEMAAVRERRPLNDVRGISIEDKWANVARALSYQPEKDNAVALMERIGLARRGAVREFHAMVPSSAVQQVSRGPDLGREIGMQHKQDLSIGRELGDAVRQVIERVRDLAERVVERFREQERYRGLER